MLRILLLGASGLVGRETLRLALGRGDVDSVVAPTRKPLPPHGKLINPVAGELESLLSDAARWTVEAVICALGTTMAKAGSRQAFYRVDHDLALGFARAAHQQGAGALGLVSAIGATPSSRFFYPRTKGKTEADIRSLGFASLTILRPLIIEGERGESRLGESTVLKLAEVLAPILPRGLRANPASTIARVLIDAVVASKPGVHFVFSQDLTAKS
jgi:uncharacterized protein YbjT (DUF2867 family)